MYWNNEWLINWNQVWESSKGFITFFFKNFPDSCDFKTLYLRFKEIEKVRDVCLLDRRDKEWKRFGFIRFGGGINKFRVEQDLNEIWFESYKLRDNLSKFSRRAGKVPLAAPNHSIQPCSNVLNPPLMAPRAVHRSYAQATSLPSKGPTLPREKVPRVDRYIVCVLLKTIFHGQKWAIWSTNGAMETSVPLS